MGSDLEVNIVGPDYPIVNLCIPYKYPQEEYSIMGVYIYSGASVLLSQIGTQTESFRYSDIYLTL